MRIVWVIAVALWLTGCNAIFGLDPTELGSGDAATPDATAIDADPLADDDDDGIVNGVDNCPQVGNPDQLESEPPGLEDGFGDVCDLCPTRFDTAQHDEDGDQLGDNCDSCPHVDNPGQEDELEPAGQADGIGDACDPNPMLAGDRQVFFDGFGGPGRAASWTVIYNDDELVVSQDALVLAAVDPKPVVAIVEATAPIVVVEVAVRVTVLDPILSPAIGVIAQHDGSAGLACVLDQESGQAPRWAIARVDDGGGLTRSGEVTTTGPFAVGQTYTLRILAGQDVPQICRARSNSFVTDAYLNGGVTPTITPSGGPGIYLQGAAVRIPYIVVWGRDSI